MQYRSSRIAQDKEMDRLLELEKHCLKSLEKSNDDNQKELLAVLDSIQRQKKQLGEQMFGSV